MPRLPPPPKDGETDYYICWVCGKRQLLILDWIDSNGRGNRLCPACRNREERKKEERARAYEDRRDRMKITAIKPEPDRIERLEELRAMLESDIGASELKDDKGTLKVIFELGSRSPKLEDLQLIVQKARYISELWEAMFKEPESRLIIEVGGQPILVAHG